jgi:hypothetical protein
MALLVEGLHPMRRKSESRCEGDPRRTEYVWARCDFGKSTDGSVGQVEEGQWISGHSLVVCWVGRTSRSCWAISLRDERPMGELQRLVRVHVQYRCRLDR